MAFLTVNQVSLRGISAAVPRNREINNDLTFFDPDEIVKLVKNTGIESRCVALSEICTSDLCCVAAENLISELGWSKDDINILVFVTQSPDYILPATSAIIQSRLALPSTCLTLDISLGCSGYVYGLSVISSMLQSITFGKGLLLVGDTSSRMCSSRDKSTYPLFGDAGTATALERDNFAPPIFFNLKSDGSGHRSIIIEDGGFRNPFTRDSLNYINFADGIKRHKLNLSLDGLDVFSFGINKAPEVVSELLSQFNIKKDLIDYFFFHQANLMMNEKIRKKLELEIERVPYSLKYFGNTSSASIPLTMVTQAQINLQNKVMNIMGCGFGVGLSWGAFYCETKKLVIPPLNYL